MTLASAIYEGTVRHRRNATPDEPRAGHEFTFPLFMAYLDLSELAQVFSLSRWWSMDRVAPVRLRREDCLSPHDLPIDEAVRQRVRRELGWRPAGPVRMLTHLRQFGYVFNPVTFYYCFDPAGTRVDAIVAEITNTPWKERHAYVLDRREAEQRVEPDQAAGSLRWRFRKSFHVSPLLPMDVDYDWAFSQPGERLAIHMNLTPAMGAKRDLGDGATRPSDAPVPTASLGASASPPPRLFDATLTLRRRELSAAAMRAQVLRFPFMTARIITRIHWEFLRTYLKGARIRSHPGAGRAVRSGVRRAEGNAAT